ncbi:hypothetical protein FACS189494_06590 [Spirochaetia bacterium]|nr:hypothetical protein FACS189494_06590 [Spirochaetia bacterium]
MKPNKKWKVIRGEVSPHASKLRLSATPHSGGAPQRPVFALVILAMFLQAATNVYAQSPRDAIYYYNAARSAMVQEDWYTATEELLECLKNNPSHAEATAALAECYYELGEYDQALVWVRKARLLSRLNMETANLEAYILTALGKLDEAAAVIKEIQTREPYNREALFAAAELDIARGRPSDALERYRAAVRLNGNDSRLLVSLALVLGSLGNTEAARQYIERAQELHSDDYRIFYYSAYLLSRSGGVSQAIRDCKQALDLRPDFLPALSLLASLRYRAGEYDEAILKANQIIEKDNKNVAAWFLKGMALSQLGRKTEAASTLETALNLSTGADEFIRAACEELVMTTSALEDPKRALWAQWHFDKAAAAKARNISSDAIFEYRRGLRLNPYSPVRRDYAEMLRLQGWNEQYLEELKFIQDLGQGTRSLNDAIETYTAVLGATLVKRWNVKPQELERHWNVAVFSQTTQAAFIHTDAAYIAASYIKDVLAHDRNINALNAAVRQPNFAAAFRTARETDRTTGARADYFFIVSVLENERDIALKADLYVARTGSLAASFNIYRAGTDRLRNAVRNITAQLGDNLPFRAALLRRQADTGLMDKGKLDGIAEGTVYEVLKKGAAEIASDGLGLKYLDTDVVGAFTTTQAIDGEVSSGTLTRRGFFDLITEGDEIFLQTPKKDAPASVAPTNSDPELRSILRTLR